MTIRDNTHVKQVHLREFYELNSRSHEVYEWARGVDLPDRTTPHLLFKNLTPDVQVARLNSRTCCTYRIVCVYPYLPFFLFDIDERRVCLYLYIISIFYLFSDHPAYPWKWTRSDVRAYFSPANCDLTFHTAVILLHCTAVLCRTMLCCAVRCCTVPYRAGLGCGVVWCGVPYGATVLRSCFDAGLVRHHLVLLRCCCCCASCRRR